MRESSETRWSLVDRGSLTTLDGRAIECVAVDWHQRRVGPIRGNGDQRRVDDGRQQWIGSRSSLRFLYSYRVYLRNVRGFDDTVHGRRNSGAVWRFCDSPPIGSWPVCGSVDATNTSRCRAAHHLIRKRSSTICARLPTGRLSGRPAKTVYSLPLPRWSTFRFCLPALVSPRKARPRWLSSQIQFRSSSFSMAGWAGSSRIASNHFWEPSWPTG
jgi:hypothetical protein